MNLDERMAWLRMVVGMQGDKVEAANARSHDCAERSASARQAADAQLRAVRRARGRCE